ncbi:hypothetical protein [Metabacillus sp. FJAT-52054]|uniref:Resolvase/invertase-type recombinase catalytic domain-containing protein n=1 Tax=Metabacillus sediminis TaxID=3117746 RepID=A0ABZ2NJ53_9BACI
MSDKVVIQAYAEGRKQGLSDKIVRQARAEGGKTGFVRQNSQTSACGRQKNVVFQTNLSDKNMISC